MLRSLKSRVLAAAAAAVIGTAAGAAFAQFVIPQVQSIGANDLFQDIVNGAPTQPNYYASQALLANNSFVQAGGLYGNALIGGDFGQNLFQRGTSNTFSASTTVAYTSADRWANVSGTGVPLTLSQQTGSTDIVPGTTASYRVNKGSGTGTAQACVLQDLESINSAPFAGQTAEFSFYAKAGSTYSAANSALNVYITYGTGTDQSSNYQAYTVTAGNAGATGWTGGVNAANGTAVTLSSGGFNRYAVAAAIPSTATQIGVALCYTPVGTGTATDWFEFAQVQLDINPALTSAVASGAVALTNDTRIKAFARRTQALEQMLQQRYTYIINEPPASTNLISPGYASSATNCYVTIPLPVPMRAAPGAAASSVSGTTISTVTSGTTWKAVAAAVAANVSAISVYTGNSNVTANLGVTTSGATTGQFCMLQGLGGGASIIFASEM